MRPMRLLYLLLCSTMLASAVNLLSGVSIEKDELRLKFSKTIKKDQIDSFGLRNPCRKVFDIHNCRIAKRDMTKGLQKSSQYAIKIAQFRPNTVRIVIGCAKPYHTTPYKPILSKRLYHIPLPKEIHSTIVTHHTAQSPKQIKNPRPPATTQKYYRTKKAKKPPKHMGRGELIVIDAGHGGHDAGAVAGGKREKDLVLQIAKRLEKQLRRKGYRVYMTRRNDRFLRLSQRTHIADKKGAKVFVSIHANSVPKSKRNRIHGIETFFLQNTRDAKSKRIAARENAAVLKGAGSRLSKEVIVDSVLNGPKIIESNKLAIDVQKRIITNLRKYYRGVKDSGVRHAPFWVLVGASRPSILVEVGYISHPLERKRLFSRRYQEQLAKGIAEGIDSYLVHRRKELGF